LLRFTSEQAKQQKTTKQAVSVAANPTLKQHQEQNNNNNNNNTHNRHTIT